MRITERLVQFVMACGLCALIATGAAAQGGCVGCANAVDAGDPGEPEGGVWCSSGHSQFCEIQGVAPAIGRMIATFDEPAMLEVIDQHHKPTWQHAQFGAKRLLTQSLRGVDESQDPGMRWDQSDSLKPLGKSGGRMRPNLSEQERGR